MTLYGTDILDRAAWRKFSAMLRQYQHVPCVGHKPAAHARHIDHGGTIYTVAAIGRDPIVIYPAVIGDQPERRRKAIELDWAARYRRTARKAYGPQERRQAITAARACIADAKAIGSAFADLP